MTLKLVHVIARGVGNPPTSFGVSRTFCSRHIGQTCQMHHVTLRPLPLTLVVITLVCVAGLRPPFVYQVWTL